MFNRWSLVTYKYNNTHKKYKVNKCNICAAQYPYPLGIYKLPFIAIARSRFQQKLDPKGRMTFWQKNKHVYDLRRIGYSNIEFTYICIPHHTEITFFVLHDS